MEIIQILIVVFALFALSRAVLRFKDNKLTINEMIFWALIWAGIILVSFLPGITILLSGLLGIGRGIDLVIYISIIVLFYLIFRLYVKIEGMEKEVTFVVRKLALNSKEKKKR
ncbi:MAG: hypothetical protein A2V69_00065 [Candidatus Portnoybacteria bacterium RBG_13_40_8]|uniref:DUF2304 domain-containing protein n=1 Tax=Candidatus Portnoybacteria bacterium RBG_13_40_8 TaxID=1801990 RepID=A0A1G2F250_9BACT|nr:MAG: hypothetical protein A2V69_00065 [Candidatus Portnoybacteria bacterium RBG_13_40_8]